MRHGRHTRAHPPSSWGKAVHGTLGARRGAALPTHSVASGGLGHVASYVDLGAGLGDRPPGAETRGRTWGHTLGPRGRRGLSRDFGRRSVVSLGLPLSLSWWCRPRPLHRHHSPTQLCARFTPRPRFSCLLSWERGGGIANQEFINQVDFGVFSRIWAATWRRSTRLGWVLLLY